MDPIDPTNTQQAQGDSDEMSIDDAIKQIKGWKEEGKTDEAIEGCKEILEADPENTEIKQMLEELENSPKEEAPAPAEAAPEVESELKVEPTAEEAPKEEEPATPTETPGPTTEEETSKEEAPVTEPAAPAEEPKDESPLYTLDSAPEGEGEEEETTEEKPADDEPVEAPSAAPTQATKEKKSHGIVLNIVIFVIIAAVIAGGIYAYLNFFKSTPEEVEITPPATEEVVEEEEATEEEAVEEEVIEEEEEPEESMETRNEERLLDLTLLEQALTGYYDNNHVYPSAETLLTDLISGGYLDEIPYDPYDGQQDEFGNPFAYSYAVYDNDLGSNQEYVLAGLFEEETGTLFWANTDTDKEDYRAVDLENVTFITAGEEEVEEEEEEPVKVKR